MCGGTWSPFIISWHYKKKNTKSFVKEKEKNNLSVLIAAMHPSNKKGQESNANNSIIHGETIDSGLRRQWSSDRACPLRGLTSIGTSMAQRRLLCYIRTHAIKCLALHVSTHWDVADPTAHRWLRMTVGNSFILRVMAQALKERESNSLCLSLFPPLFLHHHRRHRCCYCLR